MIIYQMSDAPYASWLVIVAFCFSLIPIYIRHPHRLILMLLPGIALALLSIGAALLAPHPIGMGAYLVILSFVGVSIAERYPVSSRSVLMLLLLLIFAAYELPVESFPQRPLYIGIGALIALFWRMLFCMRVTSCLMRSHWQRLLYRTQRLSADIFACLLENDYSEALYLYERRVHVSKDLVLQSLLQLRDMTSEPQLTAAQQENLQAQCDKFDDVISHLFACAQLRYRVSDPNVFAVCRPELMGVAAALQQIFQQMRNNLTHQKKALPTSLVETAIARLDDSYQNVLQISAPEPLVFVLFMADLRALVADMEQLNALF